MKKLVLFDNRTKKNKEFNLTKKDHFYSYTCGPTVYDSPHIGNFRPIIIANLIHKLIYYLTAKEPVSLQCITDIDDKIIAKAKENNQPANAVTDKYTTEYMAILKELHCDHFQLLSVTKNLDKIINYISLLNEQGFLKYEEKEIRFNTNLLGDSYWQFISQKDSKNASFAIWKYDQSRYGFKSKFGSGRPGWHTECVSLIHFFGRERKVDVHLGGQELKFPHHQNELAQYSALNKNTDLATVWLHVANINNGKEKMAKSLGNIVLMGELLKKYNFQPIILWMISANYKNELVYLPSSLNSYVRKYQIWATQIRRIMLLVEILGIYQNWKTIYEKMKISNKVVQHVLNDLNTPLALAWIETRFSKLQKIIIPFEKWGNRILKIKKQSKNFSVIDEILGGKGLLEKWAELIKTTEFLTNSTVLSTWVPKKDLVFVVKKWYQLLNKKDYKKADLLRREMANEGIFYS